MNLAELFKDSLIGEIFVVDVWDDGKLIGSTIVSISNLDLILKRIEGLFQTVEALTENVRITAIG